MNRSFESETGSCRLFLLPFLWLNKESETSKETCLAS